MFINSIKTKSLFVFFMFFGTISNAQIAKIGIKGGLNYSDFQTKNFDTKAITNYFIGPTVNMKVLENISIQGELLYSTVGAKYKKPVNEIIEQYKNELGYLSIPISLQFNISDNIYLEAGPQFSFLLKNKNHFNFSNENSYDLGILGGIGIKLFKGVNLGARYIGGTKNIYPDFNSKTSVVQAFVEIKVF